MFIELASTAKLLGFGRHPLPKLIVLRAIFLFMLVSYGFPQKPDLITQTGHTTTVDVIAFSPDNKLVATGGWDAVVRIWDRNSGLEIRAIPHPSRIRALSFSPNGELLAGASSAFVLDGNILVWNVKTGERLTGRRRRGTS